MVSIRLNSILFIESFTDRRTVQVLRNLVERFKYFVVYQSLISVKIDSIVRRHPLLGGLQTH